ncbi:hypothetical protein IVB12_15495 [Bradyrhizobium sp. 179]|uniref:hypothetical protein n=1 Tax=Bradyrhizobium sp. 179 TaxID=2782648 RepID=UPI001FFB3C8D|nr:hypothetical protein [Bradyrhizobium sp. 179]MCK1543319.1 hypothetical protein [Bradyrhizobium sp. 179]
MSYPDPDESDDTPHLDAIAMGFGVLCLIAFVPQLPGWVFFLAAFVFACWVLGWAVKFIWRFVRWIWDLAGRLEVEP